jgi:hypothetical protein
VRVPPSLETECSQTCASTQAPLRVGSRYFSRAPSATLIPVRFHVYDNVQGAVCGSPSPRTTQSRLITALRRATAYDLVSANANRYQRSLRSQTNLSGAVLQDFRTSPAQKHKNLPFPLAATRDRFPCRENRASRMQRRRCGQESPSEFASLFSLS